MSTGCDESLAVVSPDAQAASPNSIRKANLDIVARH
jgi:hypothetical protein